MLSVDSSASYVGVTARGPEPTSCLTKLSKLSYMRHLHNKTHSTAAWARWIAYCGSAGGGVIERLLARLVLVLGDDPSSPLAAPLRSFDSVNISLSESESDDLLKHVCQFPSTSTARA